MQARYKSRLFENQWPKQKLSTFPSSQLLRGANPPKIVYEILGFFKETFKDFLSFPRLVQILRFSRLSKILGILYYRDLARFLNILQDFFKDFNELQDLQRIF